MIGYIEGCRHSALTAFEVFRRPDNLINRPHSSLKTELVLQVASRMALPKSSNFSVEKFRLISNLIYSANNYWDIGLPAREQIFQNKSYQFVALTTILEETTGDMNKSLKEVRNQYPDIAELANTLISDGEILFANKNKFSGVQYREIDSGISAVFVFGSIGGKDCLQNIGINVSKKCQNDQDLFKKYSLFLVNQTNTSHLDEKFKVTVGLQAVEMMISCLDDQWGLSEDTLLRIPGTMQDGLDANKRLFNSYKKKAVECGFSRVIPEILSQLSLFHRLDSKRIKNINVLELNEIQKCQNNNNQRHYLREYLNNNSVLEELFR